MELLREFDHETSKMLKKSLKSKLAKHKRYRRLKNSKNSFNFDERSNSSDVFYTKDKQMDNFLKMNDSFEKHTRISTKTNKKNKKELKSPLEKNFVKAELKNQMKLLESEIFRC